MADCSKTVDFYKERNRMCDFYENEDCVECPFNTCTESGIQIRCEDFAERYTEKAVSVLQKWSDEHPLPKSKTYADVFFEKFPKAARDAENTPEPCLERVFGERPNGVRCDHMCCCEECWNMPYPEGGDSSGS